MQIFHVFIFNNNNNICLEGKCLSLGTGRGDLERTLCTAAVPSTHWWGVCPECYKCSYTLIRKKSLLKAWSGTGQATGTDHQKHD